MALRISNLQPLLHLLQPTIRYAPQSLLSTPVLRRIAFPQLPAATLALPLAAFAGVSDFLREIWEGILRAVPKKKTSHMKKRHRQMAGKALKDVTTLNKCSACGRVKRMHLLCPYCVEAVRHWMKEPKRLTIDPELEKNTGPNLAEHPLWQELKRRRQVKKKVAARDKRISEGNPEAVGQS